MWNTRRLKGRTQSYVYNTTKILKDVGVNFIVDLRKKSSDSQKITEIKKSVKGIDSYSAVKEHRDAVRKIMEKVVDGNVVYFHCNAGKDRTGTIAYLIEGILGVNSDDRLRDYELSYFSVPESDKIQHEKINKLNKTIKKMSGKNEEEEFINWFLKGSSNPKKDIKLINNFRKIMIDGNIKEYSVKGKKCIEK